MIKGETSKIYVGTVSVSKREFGTVYSKVFNWLGTKVSKKDVYKV